MDLQRKRIHRVDYIDGNHITDDGHLEATVKNKEIIMNSARRYYNCLYLLVGLTPVARNLMDFLVEEMDDSNIVYNNTFVRKKFIDFIFDITSQGGIHEEPKLYSDQRVKECFGQLVKTGLIKPLSRGTFKVNPEYFFVESETKRVGEIIMELKFNAEDKTSFKVIRNGRI